jgi:hypothetical protein
MTRGRNFFGQNLFFKRAFSVTFALFLVLGALGFVGCQMDPENIPPPAPLESDSPLIGTWELIYGGGQVEAYRITLDTLQYGSGSGDAFVSTFEAKIHDVQYFTRETDSGMLYIEYTTKKPEYTSGSYDAEWNYTQTGGPFDPPGNFVVVMFHDLKTTGGTTTIKLANPYKASDTHSAKGTDGVTDVTFIASEVPTLVEAKKKFNIDTESDFLSNNGWAGVSAQTRVE